MPRRHRRPKPLKPKPAARFKLKRGRKPIYTPAQMRVLRRMLAKTLGDMFRGMARTLAK